MSDDQTPTLPATVRMADRDGTVTSEQYQAAELLFSVAGGITDRNWAACRFAVRPGVDRVLLGRRPGARAPGGLHPDDELVVLSDNPRLSATAVGLTRQRYDNRWLLHLIAGTDQPGSPHRLLIDAYAGERSQQQFLGPDAAMMLTQGMVYRLRLLQDPAGPVDAHFNREWLAQDRLVEEFWITVKTEHRVAESGSDVPTYTELDDTNDKLVNSKRAFILAYAYGPFLAGLTPVPYTASTLAPLIEEYYNTHRRWPNGFEFKVLDSDKSTSWNVHKICQDEIKKASENQVKGLIAVFRMKNDEPHGEYPRPSDTEYAHWLVRLGMISVDKTTGGGYVAVVPLRPQGTGRYPLPLL